VDLPMVVRISFKVGLFLLVDKSVFKHGENQ
jgi:hypothetical protein